MQADELKGIDLSDLDELEKERLAMGQKAFKMIVYGFLGIIVVSGFLASLHLGNLFFFLLIGGVFYLGKTINGLKNELKTKSSWRHRKKLWSKFQRKWRTKFG